MLVSDYDGTFYRKSDGKMGIVLNNKAISEFRDKGNKFVIATGREFSSIKNETEIYNIPYDYLICNDGSVIFDNNDKLLHAKTIQDFIVQEIINRLEEIDLLNPILYNEFGKTKEVKNVVELEYTVDIYSKIRKLDEILSMYYPDLCFLKIYRQVFLKPKCFKDYGIEVLCSLMNSRPDKIYTIGNDKNDLEMLNRYKGYLMTSACVHSAGLERCSSVRQLVKKIV